jgi:hypothetical protein
VIRDGARRRTVYLPAGRWLPWSRDVGYARRSGGFHVRGGRTIRGRQRIVASAALDELPLFVRAGAVLPLLASDVSTLAPYRGGAVRLADRAARLRLLAFPRGTSSARAYAHDRFRSRATRGVWRLAVRGARSRRYELEAATAGIEPTRARRFRPCKVTLDGRAVPRSRWSFARAAGVLRVRFRARRGVLAVRDACA